MRKIVIRGALALAAILSLVPRVACAQPLEPGGGTVTLQNFTFDDGETLPTLNLHYLTLGKAMRDAAGMITNAVLLLHGTIGTADAFLKPDFADALYGAGQPLDLEHVFLVIPDGIGAGASSKPSDGLHSYFPRYGYKDQVRAQREVLETIGVRHLKLVLGTSMGGMQTWLWGEMYPDDMDGLVAIAATPAAISGRNLLWRVMIVDAIRNDPGWKGGDYAKDAPPRAWMRMALPLFAVMTGNAERLQMAAPNRTGATALIDKLLDDGKTFDANDVLYAFESSADYDPGPRLGAIVKPLLAINFADDLLNPPELLHLPVAPNITAVMLPGGDASYGHMTLAHADLWAAALQTFVEGLPGW